MTVLLRPDVCKESKFLKAIVKPMGQKNSGKAIEKAKKKYDKNMRTIECKNVRHSFCSMIQFTKRGCLEAQE